MTTTLKRIDQDSYAVLVDGQSVGVVRKAWSRLGGHGWIYTNKRSGPGAISTVSTCPTRKQAVSQLLSRISTGTTNDAQYQRRIGRQ